MPRNDKLSATRMLNVSIPELRRLVDKYGTDSIAEECIVGSLALFFGVEPDEWLNTDKVRHQIRKLQGRKRERKMK